MATLANYRWQPTTSRVVTVDCCGPVARGTLQTLPQILTWPMKDPGDTLDYVVDYSPTLAGDTGDSIATLDIRIAPSGIGDVSLTTSDGEGSQAVIWLSGGQAGTTYSITVSVTTNNGRSIVRTVYLPVVAMSAPAISGPALTDQMGVAITDQSGAALTT